MKKLVGLILVLLCSLTPALAQEKATPNEVYDMVVKAAYLMEQLGDEGLAAFNDPKGEFAWKDTYVFVLDCSKEIIAAHPSPKLIGLDASLVKCQKTGKLVLKEACDLAAKDQVQQHGTWTDYYWPKPGVEEPQRKLSFMIQVPNSKYQVAAGIYDDTISLEELNAKVQ